MGNIDPQFVGWLSIVALFVLLALRVPIAFVLFTIGFGGFLLIKGLNPALGIAGIVPFDRIYNYTFTVIPLFIIMGHFAFYAGFVTDVFNTMQKWLGWLPGGLVHATIGGAAAFGAACGSGLASCAIVGKVCIPEMVNNGVDRKLALGAVAAAGPLAAMIPPSNIMVIYGIITETSIGKLLIAGVIPGIVAALMFMIMVFIRVKINPSLAPQSAAKVTWGERLKSLKGVWGIAVVALIVIGGIYSGVFTPTEAGALGAFSAFVMAVAMRRLSLSQLSSVLLDTSKTVGMIFLIFACAAVFGYLLSISRIPTQFSAFIAGLEVNRYWILMGIILMYLVLGCLIDSISQMIITMPIVFPAMMALGFDSIWFGVLIVHLMEIALITPPFALNIFILRGIVKDSTMKEIIQGIGPFILADMVIMAVYIIFPKLALWLPSMMN